MPDPAAATLPVAEKPPQMGSAGWQAHHTPLTDRRQVPTAALHYGFRNVNMADLSPTDPRAALMDRLVEMRAGLVAEMVASGYSSGLGARLAEIAAALAALREETPETTGSPAPCDGAKPKERK